MRRAIAVLIKACVSGLLLWFAASRVDWSMLRDRLRDIDFYWSAVAFILLTLQTGILAARWREIVAQSGGAMTWSQAARYSFIGALFNQTMPSTIGGDAARIWLLGKESGTWSLAAYSVIVDRAVGLLALALFVVVCLPWTLAIVPPGMGQYLLLVISALGFGGLVGVFLFDAIVPERWSTYWFVRHPLRIARLTKKIFTTFPANFVIGALSIFIHVMTVVSVWMIARAMHAPVDFGQVVILIPPVMLVAAVPISIGGWGVREGVMVVAFSLVGLPQVDGFAISVMLGILLFLVGAIGGVLWIVQNGLSSLPAVGNLSNSR